MDTIDIQCEGADSVDIRDLTEFQGDLKTLSPDNAQKLRNQILDIGFSEPIAVWRSGGENYILNGHQRLSVLLGMEADGYDIPPIPVSYVEARSYGEAKRKVLALTSQYGEITHGGLDEFLAETDIADLDDFRFPEIEMEDLEAFDDFGEGDADAERQEVEIQEDPALLITCETEADCEQLFEEMRERGFECQVLS